MGDLIDLAARRKSAAPAPDTNPVWEDDLVQFPRIMAELYEAGLDPAALSALVKTPKAIATLKASLEGLVESTDLTLEEITELFERAEALWQLAKDDR